jgi:hypothetical protein
MLRVKLSLQTGVTTEIETKMIGTEMTEAVGASVITRPILGVLDSRDIAIFVRKKIAIYGSTQTKSTRRQNTATRTDSMSTPRDDSATASRNNSSSISSTARERRKTQKIPMTSLKLLL